ncbi:MAG: signal transduction histidine kinase [Alteromonadaceae bacterium]|jgi:signal transduction histidine kinase/HPt (histidine-containing phosphotransfer) domain-containing protein
MMSTSPARSRPMVLLVDDEKANLKILSDLLKDQVDITLAKNGIQAIEKTLQIKPDLILLDVIMPGMDGFEVLSELKRIEATENIPVIFITGLNSAGEEEHGLTLGAQDYIHKPFSPKVVKARVATQLEIVRQRQQLQLLSDQLSQASEAKSRFLANMSHEVRTPLTSIIGYAESIIQGDFKADFQSQAINIIAQNGSHLLNVVNKILDLSKIEANKLEMELIEMDLMAMLNDITALVKQHAQGEGLGFNIKYNYPLPQQIICDPTRLKQILLNLINNAIKFTEVGSVTMHLGTNHQNQLMFEVEDTGIGLSVMQIDKLFNDFTQVDYSITRKYGGTGLGLSIAKSLASKLGGDITVKSLPGKGSTFTVSVSMVVPPGVVWLHDAPAQYQPSRVRNVPKASMPTLKGHVLLAEDHHDNRALFTQLLKRMGLTVTAVENGELAVQESILQDFDLILMDIQMPVMDGISAMKLLKTTAMNIPIVALTANAMKNDIDSYLAAGFDCHIAKPVDRQCFAITIGNYFNTPIDEQNDFDLDEETLNQLKEQFVAGLKARLVDLSTLTDNNNWPDLAKQAHAIRGSAPMYGFDELGLLATRLEAAVKNDHTESIHRLARELLSQVDDIISCA